MTTPEGDRFNVLPSRKLSARVAGLYRAGETFITTETEQLKVDFEGIPGDLHAGITRQSGSREPWYRRRTEMRNERQLSIVSPEELDVIAARMNLNEVRPQWLGANLMLEGLASLSMLPASSLLFFEHGAVIKVDGQNAPCRQAGRAVGEGAGMADPIAGALEFPKVAKRLRGLVGWVEKPGVITIGEEVVVRVPEQWIYDA